MVGFYDPQHKGQSEIFYEITKVGNNIASKGAYVNLTVSHDNRIDSGDEFIVYEQIHFDLVQGEVAIRNVNNPLKFSFPETILSGTYYLAVLVYD